VNWASLKLPARKQQRTASQILIWDQGPKSPRQAGSLSQREAEHAGTDIEDGELDLPMNYPPRWERRYVLG
jgi:hypothetical protein